LETGCIFYGHQEYFGDIFLPLSTFCFHSVHMFSPFWYIVSRNIWQPWSCRYFLGRGAGMCIKINTFSNSRNVHTYVYLKERGLEDNDLFDVEFVPNWNFPATDLNYFETAVQIHGFFCFAFDNYVQRNSLLS
jgi:hypothetical protein